MPPTPPYGMPIAHCAATLAHRPIPAATSPKRRDRQPQRWTKLLLGLGGAYGALCGATAAHVEGTMACHHCVYAATCNCVCECACLLACLYPPVAYWSAVQSTALCWWASMNQHWMLQGRHASPPCCCRCCRRSYASSDAGGAAPLPAFFAAIAAFFAAAATFFFSASAIFSCFTSDVSATTAMRLNSSKVRSALQL